MRARQVRMRFAAASVDGSLYLFGGQGPLREKSDGTNEHPLLNVVEASAGRSLDRYESYCTKGRFR